MKKYTCDICGRVIEEETEDRVFQQVQHHLEVDHGLTDDQDVLEPNIPVEEDKIRERITEM